MFGCMNAVATGDGSVVVGTGPLVKILGEYSKSVYEKVKESAVMTLIMRWMRQRFVLLSSTSPKQPKK